MTRSVQAFALYIKPLIWGIALLLVAVSAYISPLLGLLIGVVGPIVLYAVGMTPLVATSLLLIAAPLRALVATEVSSPIDLTIPLLVFLGIAYLIHVSFCRRWTIQLSPIYVILVIFLLMTGLSIVQAASINAWFSEWLKWWILLGIAVFIADRLAYWRWLLFILVVSGISNAIVGLYIFLGGSGADHLIILDRYFRAFGTFGQPNPFGGFMGLLLPLSLSLLYGYTKSTKENKTNLVPALFYAIASLLLLLGLLVSWSRGAWLALGAALFIVFLTAPKTWLHRLRNATVSLILVLFVAGVDLLPSSITNRLGSSFEDLFVLQDTAGVDITPANYAVIERLAHWQAAWNMAEYSPWLGVGLGNYEIAYRQFSLLNWPMPLGHAHNYYLNLLSETGIIGLLSYTLLWIIVFRATWQAQRTADDLTRLALLGLLGSWSYLLAHSLLDNLYVNNLFIHLGIMFGVLAALHRQATQQTDWKYS